MAEQEQSQSNGKLSDAERQGLRNLRRLAITIFAVVALTTIIMAFVSAQLGTFTLG